MKRTMSRAGTSRSLPFSRNPFALRGVVGIRHAVTVGRPVPAWSAAEIVEAQVAAAPDALASSGAGPAPRVTMVASAP